MGRRCFYCARPASEREPGIPRWLSLPGLDAGSLEHLVAEAPPRREPRRPGDRIPVSVPRYAELGEHQPDVRLRAAIEEAIVERSVLALDAYSTTLVCAACASALDRLDARARPVVEPLIAGDVRTLEPDEQAAAAAWAARTAYAVLAIERKSEAVPESHRRALRAGGQPHGNVYVGLGRFRSSEVGVLAGRMVIPLAGAGQPPVGAYSVLAVFGHLVLKVFGIRRLPRGAALRPAHGELVRIWPAQPDPVCWPPLWGLSQQTLEHAFAHVPFHRPYKYTEIRYRGPGQTVRVRKKRTEGLRGRG